MIDPNAPAYSFKERLIGTDKVTELPGLTIRAEFAKAAMAAWRASEEFVDLEMRMSSGMLANLAVNDADALIAELNNSLRAE